LKVEGDVLVFTEDDVSKMIESYAMGELTLAQFREKPIREFRIPLISEVQGAKIWWRNLKVLEEKPQTRQKEGG